MLPEALGSPVRGLAPAVACGVLAGLAAVGQAALLSRAIDAAFLGRAGLVAIAPLLAALAATAAVRALLTSLQELAGQRFSAAARLAVRDRLLRRVLALGPRYVSGERTGELLNTLLGGVEALDAYLAQYLPQAALALLVPALVLVAVLWCDPPSALVLLVAYPLAPLFLGLIGKAAEARTRRQWQTLARLAARFHDALAGLATLKAFGRAEDEISVLAAANERHRALTMEVLRLAMASALALEALATLGTAVVAVEVGLRLLYARLSFRAALFVLVLAPEFWKPLRTLGAAFHAGLSGREAAARMDEILAQEGPLAAPELVEAPQAAPPARAPLLRARRPPRIRFDSVVVSYGPQRRALDGLSLLLEPGETLALVGPTGAGKTTAAHLLLRFLEPDSGSVLVDEEPLSAMAPVEWRRHVAWVPQQARLFHGTLRDNLRLGRPDATEPELSMSLRLAGLEDLVGRLPRGLETHVGEGGARLSGGEAQRVALARAFLKDAPLVVLDEPTAQLDLATEAAVVAGVRQLCRSRTVLLIAHRLTSVAAADRVCVLARGRMVEAGTPSSLGASGGLYARLLAAWGGAS
jgi:thiol reductant ABC exporter CydD subunit